MLKKAFLLTKYKFRYAMCVYLLIYLGMLRISHIFISEPGQPFRSQFVLYRTDIGLIEQTINRTSRCNKVDAVRRYASYRLNLLIQKGQRCVHRVKLLGNYLLSRRQRIRNKISKNSKKYISFFHFQILIKFHF